MCSTILELAGKKSEDIAMTIEQLPHQLSVYYSLIQIRQKHGKIHYLQFSTNIIHAHANVGAQWLSGRKLESRRRATGSSFNGVTELCP